MSNMESSELKEKCKDFVLAAEREMIVAAINRRLSREPYGDVTVFADNLNIHCLNIGSDVLAWRIFEVAKS